MEGWKGGDEQRIPPYEDSQSQFHVVLLAGSSTFIVKLELASVYQVRLSRSISHTPSSTAALGTGNSRKPVPREIVSDWRFVLPLHPDPRRPGRTTVHNMDI